MIAITLWTDFRQLHPFLFCDQCAAIYHASVVHDILNHMVTSLLFCFRHQLLPSLQDDEIRKWHIQWDWEENHQELPAQVRMEGYVLFLDIFFFKPASVQLLLRNTKKKFRRSGKVVLIYVPKLWTTRFLVSRLWQVLPRKTLCNNHCIHSIQNNQFGFLRFLDRLTNVTYLATTRTQNH